MTQLPHTCHWPGHTCRRPLCGLTLQTDKEMTRREGDTSFTCIYSILSISFPRISCCSNVNQQQIHHRLLRWRRTRVTHGHCEKKRELELVATKATVWYSIKLNSDSRQADITCVKALSDRRRVDHVTFTQTANDVWIQQLQTYFPLHHIPLLLHVTPLSLTHNTLLLTMTELHAA